MRRRGPFLGIFNKNLGVGRQIMLQKENQKACGKNWRMMQMNGTVYWKSAGTWLMNMHKDNLTPVSIIAEVDLYKFDPWELPVLESAMLLDAVWREAEKSPRIMGRRSHFAFELMTSMVSGKQTDLDL